MEKETIFTKIRDGIIPSNKLYEDELCFVILDINPIKKGHILVISNKPYTDISECPDDVISHLIKIAKMFDLKLREKLKCDGTNILINNGSSSGQEIPHIHIHVIPRYKNDGIKFGFSHEKYEENEISKFKEMLI